MLIGLDFDGTCVTHMYPEIGADIGAIPWLQAWQQHGAKIILWTMRSGEKLQEAVDHLTANGINLHGINENPTQKSWTESPKAYCQLYVDDAAFGCPLLHPPTSQRPFVDWSVVGPAVLSQLQGVSRAARS